MVTVRLVTNDGAGIPKDIDVVSETTLGQFLGVHFDGNLNDYTIRIRANGASIEAHEDYVLQDGDRVSLAPKKIEGALA